MISFLKNIVSLTTEAPVDALSARQLCLWSLIDKLHCAAPLERAALVRYRSKAMACSQELIEQVPLGPVDQPMKHLEKVWKSQRGKLIGCEPIFSSSSGENLELRGESGSIEKLLTQSFYCLRSGGVLILPLDSAQQARRSASHAIKAGFEVSFLRCYREETVGQERENEPKFRWRLQHEEPIETLQESYHAGERQVLFLLASRPERLKPGLKAKKRKAFVYNCYLDTGGGGERSSLDFAAALDDIGYEVSLVSTRPININLESLKSSFGVDERFDWAIRYFETQEDLSRAVKKEGVEVFVNHTYSSFMSNPAAIGVYVAMFPTPTLPDNIKALLTYDVICCISEFTQEYVSRFWYDKLPCEVIYPPISQVHQDGELGSFENKQRLVIQIGRFNTEGHSKCQLEAIETFVRLRKENILGSSWKMKVLGRVNSGANNERYIEDCRNAIENTDVEIITNGSLEVIRDLYRKACCLWQYTGYGLDYGEAPQFCEHLGLVAMDCFSYGTIPIIYHRGGMVPLINHGENGFSFGSQQELMETMSQISTQFGSDFHRRIYQNSKDSTKLLCFSEYRDSVQSMLWRIGRDKKTLSVFGCSKLGASNRITSNGESDNVQRTTPIA